jgi:hypothetical protein
MWDALDLWNERPRDDAANSLLGRAADAMSLQEGAKALADATLRLGIEVIAGTTWTAVPAHRLYDACVRALAAGGIDAAAIERITARADDVQGWLLVDIERDRRLRAAGKARRPEAERMARGQRSPRPRDAVLSELMRDPGRNVTAIAKAAGVNRTSIYDMTFDVGDGVSRKFEDAKAECERIRRAANARGDRGSVGRDAMDLRQPDGSIAKLPAKRR